MEKNPRVIARDLASSITSELRAYIFHKDLVDDNVVEEVLKKAGVRGLLVKWHDSSTGIIVYYIKNDIVEKECMYNRCVRVDSSTKKECLEKCREKMHARIAKSIAESIVESVNISLSYK